ncbi:MAG: cation:proton antiporter subunit C [Candidatus Thermoplasmatota archaeon]
MIENGIYNIPFIAVAALVIIGLYTIILRKNLIKIVIGVTILECGVNLFLITLGFRKGSLAPIFTSNPNPEGVMSSPVPQALTLTSIVIGVAVLALMLSLVIHLYRHYDTLDATKLGGEKE